MPLTRYTALCLLILALGWTGCGDAARENPLDPNSEGFRDEGGIEGRITSVYRDPDTGQEVGQANVAVRFVPVGPAGRPELATRTDTDGFFALGGVPAGPYAVVAEASGFRAASDTVTVEVGRVADTVLQLDALPRVDVLSLRTVHIVRWFPEDPVFQLEVDVTATDPDRARDVASAALAVPDPTAPEMFATFEIDPVAGELGRFSETFDDSVFPAGVAGLLGEALRIQVRDVADGVTFSDPVGLVRVIQLSPQTLSPQGEAELTDPTPTLVWRPAELAFGFTYRVDVYIRDPEGGSTLLDPYPIESIPPSQTSLTLTQPLEPGAYWWAVWVVDAAGNRSRSKQAGFTVR